MNQEKMGKFIAKLRKEKKLTQEQLAEKLGVTSKSISRWENGQYLPDLSLLKPLSEILEVSINELMSGEKVSKEEYQERFEENVVTAISDVDTSNKKSNLVANILIGIIALIFIWFIGAIIYSNVEFTRKYDELNMKFDKDSNDPNGKEKNYMFYSTQAGDIKTLITTYKENDEEIGIIFINFYQTLEHIVHDNHNYKNIDLTKERFNYGQGFSLKDSKIPKTFKVYYTTTNFKKIANANNKELESIIQKSNLMYEETE